MASPPMTYLQQASLMLDPDFRSRIKVAVLHFANYIMNEPVTTANDNTRRQWARNAQTQPDIVAGNLQANVVMDPNVQSAGAAITDTALQTAVEDTIQALW